MFMHFDQSQVGCREVKLFLYDYAERTLDPRLCMALDAHVIGCDACQRTIGSYKQSSETAQKVIPRDVEIPGQLKHILVERLNQPTD
jgi:hypothetical protein